jgi:F0F1-type ATP synthase assembly protein I
MTQQRQSFGPGKVLAQVTLIVALPLVGGVIAGLVADGMLETSPLFALSGLAIGTLVTVLWMRWYIMSNAARLRGTPPPTGTDRGEKADNTEQS